MTSRRQWCRKKNNNDNTAKYDATLMTIPSPTLTHLHDAHAKVDDIDNNEALSSSSSSGQSTVEWAAQRYAVWMLCNILLSWVFVAVAFICLQIWPLHPDTLREWLLSLPLVGRWSAGIMDTARERLPAAANDVILAYVIGKVFGPVRNIIAALLTPTVARTQRGQRAAAWLTRTVGSLKAGIGSLFRRLFAACGWTEWPAWMLCLWSKWSWPWAKVAAVSTPISTSTTECNSIANNHTNCRINDTSDHNGKHMNCNAYSGTHVNGSNTVPLSPTRYSYTYSHFPHQS